MQSEINAYQSDERKKVLFISSKIKRITNWTKEEDKILREKAEEYNYKNWKHIAGNLPGRTDIQCSARYKRIKPGIVKGSWTTEEDDKLVRYIKKFGKNWSLISKYMPSRSGKQIRDRYLNTLDPSTKKERFSKQEDLKVIELFIKYGPAWSKISTFFEGRTGDMIKNRFYSSLKRRIGNKEFNIKEVMKDSSDARLVCNQDKTLSISTKQNDSILEQSQNSLDKNLDVVVNNKAVTDFLNLTLEQIELYKNYLINYGLGWECFARKFDVNGLLTFNNLILSINQMGNKHD